MAGRGYWYITSLLAIVGILCHPTRVTFVGMQHPIRARAAVLREPGLEDVTDAMAHVAKNLLEMLKLPKLLEQIERDNTSELLKETTFPRIVVMGDENAGKSSTLERIAGVDVLPRSHGITTRQPVVLRLRHEHTISFEAPQLTLRIPGQDDLLGLTAEEIRERISAHMQEIAEQKRGVEIGSEIEVEVRSNGVPSVDLVDLPGLIAVRVGSDTEPEELAELSEKCTKDYLDHEATGAVMCVLDATIDNMRTSRALRMVQDSRSDLKQYTIGVLAKADKSFDQDWEEEGQSNGYWKLGERIAGQSADYVPLDFGYVPVKNRNTQSRITQHDIQNHNLQEEQWFDEHMPGINDVGIRSVIQRLDRLFYKFLGQDYVPKKTEELNTEREACMKNLELLGADPESLVIPDVVAHFTQGLRDRLHQGAANEMHDEICESLKVGLPGSDATTGNRFASVAVAEELRNYLSSAIQDRRIVDVAHDGMKKIVREVFDGDTQGHVRLCRFSKFHAAADEVVADTLSTRLKNFESDALTTLVTLCCMSRGEHIDGDRLCKAMADCALANFVLPVASPQALSDMSQSQYHLSEDCAEERAAFLAKLAQIDKALKALHSINNF